MKTLKVLVELFPSCKPNTQTLSLSRHRLVVFFVIELNKVGIPECLYIVKVITRWNSEHALTDWQFVVSLDSYVGFNVILSFWYIYEKCFKMLKQNVRTPKQSTQQDRSLISITFEKCCCCFSLHDNRKSWHHWILHSTKHIRKSDSLFPFGVSDKIRVGPCIFPFTVHKW